MPAASPPLVVLPTTTALEQLLLRAAWIGKGDGPTHVASFTSLFLAFLASHDDVSLWVQDKIGWIGPALADVVRRWNADSTVPRGLDEARVRRARTLTEHDLGGIVSITTPSTVTMLTVARNIATRVGATQIDTRHVLAAYVYAEHAHKADLAAWIFDREAWATRFRCFVTEAHPTEAGHWRVLHDEVFPWELSVGVAESLNWASKVAAEVSAQSIDARALLAGILLDGLAYSTHEVASAQLVKLLGGGPAVEALLDDAERVQAQRTSAPAQFADEAMPIFNRALVFATAVRRAVSASEQSVGRLHVRHVICALLTDRRPLTAFALLRRAGRTPEGLLAQFRRWLDAPTDGGEDRDVHNRIFDELRDDVLAGYDNDEAHGEDRLNIDPDVRALAAVLASTKVSPPLSVGLFGDWGSGKSFFMAKLRDRIERLADAARARPAAESWFCGKRGRVVQIDFNAWHYMDADLWSSLAVRVFEKLSDEFKDEFAKACMQQLESLKERATEIEEARRQLESKERQLDTLLDDHRRVRAQRSLAFRDYLEGAVGALAADVAADPQVKAITRRLQLEGTELQTELHLVKSDLRTIGGTVRRFWQARRAPGRFIALATLIGAPVAGAALVSTFADGAYSVAGALGGVTAAVGAIAPFVRRTATQLKSLLGDALDRVDRIESAARAKQTQQELELERDREDISTRISSLEREQLALSKRRADLEAELATLQQGDRKSLKDFILQRAAADDYRKNLGVISAVHRDFKQLADFLVPSDKPPNVERIILYIDDLDRCSPERVVEVLQAIHVILSLPLFVVVVAVDSRWLLDSLTTYYRRQFPIDATTIDAARPQHYLEKIFQIPYTLMPMSSGGYHDLVGSLLKPHVDAPAAPDTATTTVPAATGNGHAAAAHTAAATRTRPAGDPIARVDLMPRGLRLEPPEHAYVTTLAGLIGSPRAAKRLVNLYRIVRAGLSDEALDQLISGRYKITQLCLAIVVGNPTLGAEIFGQVLSRQLTSSADLIRWCHRRSSPAHKPTVRDIATLREILARTPELADWPAVCDAVRSVARFSFETGRVLGLYASDVAPPAT